MNKTEGGMKNTPWGDIQVYREFKPRSNGIEFTIYFKLSDGVKYRIDIDGTVESWDRISSDPEGPGIENYIYDLMAKLIKEGKYVEATKFIAASEENDYKAYVID